MNAFIASGFQRHLKIMAGNSEKGSKEAVGMCLLQKGKGKENKWHTGSCGEFVRD
jgi:hypothetical protein